MKAIINKIDRIAKMFDQYNALDETSESIEYYDHATYKITDFAALDRYFALRNEMNKVFKDIRRNIRSLADDLGFVITKHEFLSLVSTWQDIFNEIRHRWDAAMNEMHNIYWCNSIKNAE